MQIYCFYFELLKIIIFIIFNSLQIHQSNSNLTICIVNYGKLLSKNYYKKNLKKKIKYIIKQFNLKKKILKFNTR